VDGERRAYRLARRTILLTRICAFKTNSLGYCGPDVTSIINAGDAPCSSCRPRPRARAAWGKVLIQNSLIIFHINTEE
jgi:hypothetical protein